VPIAFAFIAVPLPEAMAAMAGLVAYNPGRFNVPL
jgi:hypothetical protein